MADEVERIAAAIETSPGWVRVGIAAPDQRLRRDAIESLAAIVAQRIERPFSVRDPNQMALPL